MKLGGDPGNDGVEKNGPDARETIMRVIFEERSDHRRHMALALTVLLLAESSPMAEDERFFDDGDLSRLFDRIMSLLDSLYIDTSGQISMNRGHRDDMNDLLDQLSPDEMDYVVAMYGKPPGNLRKELNLE